MENLLENLVKIIKQQARNFAAAGSRRRIGTYLRRGRGVGVVEDDDGPGGDDDGDLADARQRVEELLDERHLGGAADPQHVEVGLLGPAAAGRARRRRVPHPCSAPSYSGRLGVGARVVCPG